VRGIAQVASLVELRSRDLTSRSGFSRAPRPNDSDAYTSDNVYRQALKRFSLNRQEAVAVECPMLNDPMQPRLASRDK